MVLTFARQDIKPLLRGGWVLVALRRSVGTTAGDTKSDVGSTPPPASVAESAAGFTLASKYGSSKGRVYMSGLQALTKLPLLIRERDAERGLNTAGFISGYRGSPLGGYDQHLWQAKEYLTKANVEFVPGINEEIAATAVWGSQQAGASAERKFDGVFGIWYGKGPGLDRSNDAMKHANMAGSSTHGGVLCLVGDDHAAKSSTLPHASEYNLRDMNIPCLNPSSVSELLRFGLMGIEMSRFSGTWVGMKVTAETCDSSCSLDLADISTRIVTPSGFDFPPGGLNIRLPDHWNAQEERLYRHKIRAVLAFSKANQLDRRALGAQLGQARLGIATAGKSYMDVVQCLCDLGLDEDQLKALGVSVYKVGLVWPLEPDGLRMWAEGLEEVLVVEEKRSLIETQIREILYDWDRRPRVVGKAAPGQPVAPSPLLKQEGELSPTDITRAVKLSLDRVFGPGCWGEDGVQEEGAGAGTSRKVLLDTAAKLPVQRLPYFCAGCPHNTGTTIPDGALALGGIGCHTLGIFMGDRGGHMFTQMGCEGANWIGQSPFVKTPHAFANVGDGTYVHSALLSIRACVAAGRRMTFKILYNGAVAMTGGQSNDTKEFSTPDRIAAQLLAEGVGEVVIVTDDTERYRRGGGGGGGVLPAGVKVEHRRSYGAVQRRLQGVDGVTAIIYDQACATEKRRKRKRGTLPQAPERVFIHAGVCEGCGDCGQKSNCVAITPRDTPLGRKRAVDQSQCTQDTQCVAGFCPSFVTVTGGTPRAKRLPEHIRSKYIAPAPLPSPDGGDVLVCGVGGTGVVTVAALLGMAAHIENKHVNVLDQIGLSQKGGPVVSHVRVSHVGDAALGRSSSRIGDGAATAVLACDLITALLPQHLACISPAARTQVIANLAVSMPGNFARAPDMQIPVQDMVQIIARAVGDHQHLLHRLDFTALSREVLGDAVLANVVILGYALQAGALPVGDAAVRRAIQTMGVSVQQNLDALDLGRHACADVVWALGVLEGREGEEGKVKPAEVDGEIAVRVEALVRYQDAAYAGRYEQLVSRVRRAEELAVGTNQGHVLTRAAVQGYYKVLAYKDEYEVARLHSDGSLDSDIAKHLTGPVKLTYHLAPPLFAPRDPHTGVPQKIRVPEWLARPMFKALASLKSLRGGWLDLFGYTEERRWERRAIQEYEGVVERIVQRGALCDDNYRYAVELLEEPVFVRGFGHVKGKAAEKAKARRAELLQRFQVQKPHVVELVERTKHDISQ